MPRQEAETTSRDNICVVITQHWTWCEILAGLSEGHRSDDAAWAALRYFSPVVPSEERDKGCLGGACPTYRTAASHLCHCSQVLLLTSFQAAEGYKTEGLPPCMALLPRKPV